MNTTAPAHTPDDHGPAPSAGGDDTVERARRLCCAAPATQNTVLTRPDAAVVLADWIMTTARRRGRELDVEMFVESGAANQFVLMCLADAGLSSDLLLVKRAWTVHPSLSTVRTALRNSQP